LSLEARKNKVIKQKQKRKERKLRIAKIKNSSCVDCGNIYSPCAMDFDHKDPKEKVSNVSILVGQLIAWDRVQAEIKKCDLVCANCHRLRTYKESKRPLSIQYRYNKTIIDAVKRNTACVNCGKFFEPCQLDFDHTTKNKVADITRLLEKPFEVLLDEIRKCQLVCANCHRIRSTTGIRKQDLEHTKILVAKLIALQKETPFPEDKRLGYYPWIHLLGVLSPKEIAQQYNCDIRAVHRQMKIFGIKYKLIYPWYSLLGKVSDIEIAQKYNVSIHIVRAHRFKLGVAVYKKPEEIWIKYLGTMSDFKLASLYNKHPEVIRRKRNELEIPPFKLVGAKKKVSYKVKSKKSESSHWWFSLIGTMSDRQVAKIAGVSFGYVSVIRQNYGIPVYKPVYPWLDLVGTMSDQRLAKKVGLSSTQIGIIRRSNGISSFKKAA
jgi:hypothetical protein